MNTATSFCNTELEKRILAPHLDENYQNYETNYPSPDPDSFFHKEHAEIARAVIAVRDFSRPRSTLVDDWIGKNIRIRRSSPTQIHEICIKQTSPSIYKSDLDELQRLAALREGHDSLHAALAETDSNTSLDDLKGRLGKITDRLQSFAPKKRGYRTLGDFLGRQRNPDDEIFRHRFLCRGGGLLFVGSTGQGKSSFINQAVQFWATGRPAFGFCPARPLNVLIFNGENDDDDTQDFCEGVSHFDFSEQEQARIKECVHYADARSLCGDAFIAELKRLLSQGNYDLVTIDPAFSFFGGGAMDQQEVTNFLRNKINPLLDKFKCGILFVAHTAKPRADAQPTPDAAYMAFGSAEWANWARAVVVLERVEDGVFRLRVPKRGGRLKWRDESSNHTLERGIKWSLEEDRFTWEEASPSEVQQACAKRRKKMPSWQEAMGIFPKTIEDRNGRLKTEEVKEAFLANGWDKDTYREVLDDLLKRGEIICVKTGSSSGKAYIRKELAGDRGNTFTVNSVVPSSPIHPRQLDTISSRGTELGLGE